MDDYEFILWDENGDRLIGEIERQDVVFQMEFHLFVEKTSRFGWARSELLETLDGRYETYVLPVIHGDPRCVMLTRGTQNDCYTYLGITCEADHREAVYQVACQAHDLKCPRRVPRSEDV